jgi:hypothetical protein
MTRTCEDCGRSFPSRRCDARHCSAACKQRAYRLGLHRSRAATVDVVLAREPHVIDRLRARQLTPEDAIFWVVAPEEMRARASVRAEAAA